MTITSRVAVAIIGVLVLAPTMAEDLVFSVDKVLLDGVVGVVDIKSGSGEETRVEVQEPTDFKDVLRIHASGSTLKITGLASHSSYSSQVTVGSITNIAEGPGSTSVVSIGGKEVVTDDHPLRLSISLAAGRDVELSGAVGEVNIGSIDGTLRGEANGACRIHAQALGGVALQLNGSGSLDVEKVHGDVQLQVGGSSQATIRAGEIGDLSVIASGASGVRIEPLADTAKVKASGASEVALRGSKNQPQFENSGAADIQIINMD